MGAVVSLVLLVLLTISAGLVHIPAVQRLVLDKGRQYLLDRQSIDLEADRVRYNLFLGAAYLDGVRIRSTAAPDLEPFFEADRLEIDLRMTALPLGKLVIEQGKIGGGRIRVIVGPDGTMNLPANGGSNGEPSDPNALPFTMEAFEADGAELLYRDESADQEVALRDWRLSLKGDRTTQRHEIELSAGPTSSARFDGREAPLSTFALNAELRPGLIEVRRFDAASGATTLALTGAIRDFGDPRLNLVARINSSGDDLSRWAALDKPVGGEFAIEARLRQRLENLRVEATASGRDVAYGAASQIDLFFSTTWDRGAERMVLEPLYASAPAGAVAGRLDLALSDAGRGEADLRVRRLDLEALTRELETPVRIAARSTGRVQVSWPGLDFATASGSGDLTLTAKRATPSRDVLPVSGRLRLEADAGAARLALNAAEALGTSVNGDVSLSAAGELGGRLNLAAASLASVTEAADAFLGRPEGESVAPVAVDGPAAVAAELSGTTAAPEARIELLANGLSAGELTDVDLTASARYSPDRVEVEDLSAVWKGQRLALRGTAELGGDIPVLDLEVEAIDGSIEAVLAALGRSDVPASGRFSLSASVEGEANRPRVDARLRAAALEAYGESWGALSAAIDSDGPVVELREFEVTRARGGRLRATGGVDLDSREIRLKLAGDRILIESLELPSGQTVATALDIALNASGDFENPRAEWSIRAADLRLDELELGTVELRGEAADRRAAFTLEAPKPAVLARGSVGFDAPHPTELSVDLTGFDLAKLGLVARGDKPIEGTVVGRLEASGDLENWRAGQANLEISEVRAGAAGLTIGNREPIRAWFRDRVLGIDSLTVEAGRSTFDVSGTMPLTAEQPSGEMRLDGSVNLEIVSLLTGRPVDELFLLGILDVQGLVSGSLEDPRPELTAALDSGTVLTPDLIQPVINISARLEADRDKANLTAFEAEWSRAKIRASGGLPLALLKGPGDEPARVEATLDGLNLEALDLADLLGGRLSAKVSLRTADLRPEAVEGEVVFEEFAPRLEDLNLQQSEPSTIVLRGGVLETAAFHLTGPATDIRFEGRADVLGDEGVDARLLVEADAGVSTYFTEGLSMSGPFRAEIAVAGPLDAPELDGTARWRDGTLHLESPRLDAEQMNVALTLEGKRVVIDEFSGTFNGGAAEASGEFELGEGGLATADASFSARDVFMDFPPGLRTLSRLDLRFHSLDSGLLMLDGSVAVEEGSFRERVDLQSDLLTFLRSGGGLDFAEEPDPLLSRLRYNVEVQTENPILFDNNLAQMETSLNLRVVGTYYRPSLLGRVVLEEGGEVYLAENDYVIEQGVIDFTNETRIQPSLNLTARTQAAGHDITLQATGTADDLDTQFTSDSGLSEPDILSVLLTGKTLEEAQESGLNVARDQALSYLTGSLGGRVGQAAADTLGITRVRIEPNLISSEEDPTARLTIGQQLTRRLNLIYSTNLTDSSDQIFVTEYDVTRRFSSRAVKQSDNSYRFDFRHDLRWGGQAADTGSRSQGPERSIGEIEITGELAMEEAEARGRLGVESGDRYDFFKIRRRVDKLRESYRNDGRLEALVRVRRRNRDSVVDLRYEIQAGPIIEFAFEPTDIPGSVRKEVRRLWGRGVFEEQRVNDAKSAILKHLYREGYLQATVEHQIEIVAEGHRRVRFILASGPRYRDTRLEFEGNEAKTDEFLRLIVDRSNLRDELKTKPREVASTIERFYRQEGFLDVEVERPEYELEADTGTGRVVVRIVEGRPFRIGELTFQGVSALPEAQLRAAVTPPPGRFYTPKYLDESLRRIEDLYWREGYNDVVVNFGLTRDQEAARVHVAFEIQEGRRHVIREVAVEGNEHVSEKLIRGRLTSTAGDALVSDANDKSRRGLYQTGAFALVDLNAVALAPAEPDAGVKPIKLIAKVREVSPFRFRYGGFMDTDRGPGVIADLENRNMLGSARVVGMRTRYDNDFREIRGFFSQPLFNGLPLNTTAAVFRSREFRSDFITDRTGFSAQQEAEFMDRRLILTYGYRFENTRTFEREPDPFLPFDQEFDIARLNTTLSYDSRDEILDATRGQFWSNGFEFAPSFLGSDVEFVRYFGQFFNYKSFFKPETTPFDDKPRRPRLVLANGLRVGLAGGLGGQDVVPSERFFAGGGTTVRGFRQDELGPRDFFGEPTGGNAVFIANSEARFPMFSIFEGVGFVDLGQVYRRVSDFDLSDLRTTAGFGLRVRTDFFLIRVDYGVKLDRRPDEAHGTIFFSIGQAF